MHLAVLGFSRSTTITSPTRSFDIPGAARRLYQPGKEMHQRTRKRILDMARREPGKITKCSSIGSLIRYRLFLDQGPGNGGK